MKTLLKDITDSNILLEVIDGNLKVFTGKNHVNPDLIARIKEHKEELISHLLSNKQDDFQHSFKANIPVVATQPSYPLSSAQHRLWVLSQSEKSNPTYNITQTYLFEGDLSPNFLQVSFNKLIDRHEIFRTVFKADENGTVKQFILPSSEVDLYITTVDLRGKENIDDAVNDIIKKEYGKSFNLAADMLVRASLVQVEDDKWIFICVMHHIISDAWSMGILIKELLLFYNAQYTGSKESIAPLELQYKDFSSWEQSRLNTEEFISHRNYWATKLAGDLPVLELPADNPRPLLKTYNGGIVEKALSQKAVERIKSISHEQGSTFVMSLMAAIYALLYRYTSQEDIIIGIPTAGRDHIDLEEQMGLFLNTLPLRTQFNGKLSYKQLLEKVKNTTLEALEHQSYPFDELVAELNPSKDLSRSAFFDVLVDFHNISRIQRDQHLACLSITDIKSPNHLVSKFDLTFMFIESDNEFVLSLEYNSDLYQQETIERMHNHFDNLLDAIGEDPNLSIDDLDYLGLAETNTITEAFNSIPENYTDERLLIPIFEQKAGETPDAIAVTYKETALTCRELDEESNRLANYLCSEYQIDSGDKIGIIMDRSEKMIIAILGVLKAGAAYVPIDPSYPAANKQYIVNDTSVKLILTQTEYIFDLDYYTGNVFAMDVQMNALDTPSTPTGKVNSPDDLAYVIYTSGSTGYPKGCQITHSNLAHYIKWSNNYYFRAQDQVNFGLFTSLSFDLTVTSIFCALTHKGKLHVFEQNQLIPDILTQSFAGGHDINAIKLTPSHIRILKQLNIASTTVKIAIAGGEEVTKEHVTVLKNINPNIKIYNEYGPTEATVGCIVAELAENAKVLIGQPISKTRIYILNKGATVCPVGIPGEIYIGGEGVTLGYLNKSELTNEKFIPSPFIDGDKLYKSGDLAKWLPDGNVQYLGRLDDQVKVKGYRIELGAIETALTTHPAVDSAVVLLKSGLNDENELYAYITSKHSVNSAELRQHLNRHLPSYMLPGHFIQLPEFPITVNGKIDKRRISELEGVVIETGVEFVEPQNATEHKLVQIWKEILGKEKIGMHDNFFALGGDSIKAITFVVNVNKSLGKVMSVDRFYECQTLADVAAYLLLDYEILNNVYGHLDDGLDQIQKFKLCIEQENLLNRALPDLYEDIYPLVAIEQGMIYSSMANLEEPVYYDQFSYLMTVENFDYFKTAMNALIQRHPILRTLYYMNSFSLPAKVVVPVISVPFSYTDLSDLPSDQTLQQINKYIKEDLSVRLSFDNQLLWRVNVFKLEGNQYHITYSFHHALLDGWSVSVFKTELSNFNQKELLPLKHSYKDYCAISLGKKRHDEIDAYWRNLLMGYTKNKLPFNYKGLRINEDKGMNVIGQPISDNILSRLNNLSANHQVSFKAICVAAHVFLLHIICSEQDVITGVVSHDRPEIEDGEKILGCFLNTIPTRIEFGGHKDVMSLIKQVNTFLTEVRSKEIHLTEIVRIIEDKVSSSNPVFDTILNFTDFHTYENLSARGVYAGLQEPGVEVANEMTNTLFDVEVDKTLNKFSARIKYSPAYFNEEDVRFALKLYIRILEFFSKDGYASVNEFVPLSSEEFTEIVVEFNQTEEPYEREKTINKLLEEQVEKTPHAVAISQNGANITYRELNEKSNRLAHYLIEQGVKPGQNIGLLVTRSSEMIIGMYGILKAGGAYVPIDPEYSLERQGYILHNSSVAKVITDSNYPLVASETAVDFVILSSINFAKFSSNNPNLTISSEQLAYTIYTSGSTGRPKGVMIEHHSVVNLVDWVNTQFNVGPADRILFITSMCFDLSVYDIFGTLASGASIVIATHDEVQDSKQLKRLLTQERITFWDSVPTTMNYLVGELEQENAPYIQSDLRVVFLSGDWIPVQLPDRISRYFPNANIVSLGGATEGTVWSNYYPINAVNKSWSSIPYGKPIKNNCFYILDDHLRPVPKGVAGELYIGGVGVARGYENDNEKTSFSFKSDPFNSRLGGRMYKTGDLGKMMPDGNMEFLGRKDNQVKIRGFRVELGEIESVLLRNEEIKEAIVNMYKDSSGNNQLCAYLVVKGQVNTSEIKDQLKKILPSYMVPNQYMQIEALPLNSNGKINRKALPKPAADNSMIGGLNQPYTEIEIKIAQIWKSILNIEKIGLTDDVFELGANSLSVGAFVNRIHRETGQVVTIRDVFVNPTIESIAKILDQTSENAFKVIPKIGTKPSYKLSSSQMQVWVLSQFEEASLTYHIPGTYFFEGQLDYRALEYAFEKLIERHEILRTVFNTSPQGDVYQTVLNLDEVIFTISNRNLIHEINQEYQLKRLMDLEFSKPFDLQAGPLIRASLFQLSDQKWFFTYTIHHIISDGWSTGILIKELLLFYQAFIDQREVSLPALRIHYKDYAAWQQEKLSGDNFNAHKEYWLNQFKGELPVLELPGYQTRPAVKTFNGRTLQRQMSANATAGLKSMASNFGGTIFMGLLAAINTLFYKYTGLNDIVLGSLVAGRDHADLEDQIGFYVNTIALRTRFSGDDTYSELFEKVKQVSVGGFSHQEYPYDELVHNLNIQRDISRGTLFDVMVILQNNKTNYENARHELTDVTISDYDGTDNKNSKFDIVFDFAEIDDKLQLNIEFNSDIYNSTIIARLGDHLENLITAAAETPHIPISKLNYIGESEMQKLLIDFNDTAAQYAHESTIAALFEKQAYESPYDVAVVFENAAMTYIELNELSNQFADYLSKNYQVLPHDFVAVKLQRNEMMVVAMLAVLKLGAVCVPVDGEYPQDRINYIINDCSGKVLVDDEELDRFRNIKDGYCSDNRDYNGNPNDLSYIIYTSGSTGKPKGCMLENRGIINHLFSKIRLLNLNRGEVICHNSEFHFVGGTWQLWAPLITGGKVVLCSYEEMKNIERLFEKADLFDAKVLEIIPSQLNGHLMLADGLKLPTIQTLILTGEKLNAHFVNQCYQRNPG